MASSVVVNTDVARALSNGKVIQMIINDASIRTFEEIDKRISKTQGTGKGYKRNGVVHVASAPGQPPTVDTGYLKSTLSIKNPRTTFGGFRTIISVAESPGLDLEFGNSKLAARPFFISSLNYVLSTQLDQIINKVIGILETKPRIFEYLKLGGAPQSFSDGRPANRTARRLRSRGRTL